jgi:flagellar export protein FliJ
VAFRFSLASVLRVRESFERSEELALQKVELELARVQRRIEELGKELDKVIGAREQALQHPTPAYRLREMQDGIDSLVGAKQALAETLRDLRERRDAQLKRYQVAHNNRRMLTEVRSQQRESYEQQQGRAQQKQLDDLFGARRQRG